MSPDTLFMTGASGFLGKRILRNYLRKPISILLLVEPRFVVPMRSFLKTWRSREKVQAEVFLLEGDITKPGLGLSEKDFALTREATVVLHVAAAYHLTLPREVGVKVNVEGTENVLDLVGRMPALRRFGYLSTTAISGTSRGLYRETDFDVGQRFKNFYEETKFLAEKKVRERMGCIPTTIFRPTIVVGDSRTGEIEKIDGPYYSFVMISRKMHAVLPRARGVRCHIEPVDFVTDAIVSIMNREEGIGRTVHIADPRPLTYDEFFDLVFERWGTFRPILRPPASWVYPIFFLPGFSKITGVPRQSFVYTMTPVEYGTDEMMRLLAGTDISCPPVPSYIDVMIRFFREWYAVGANAGARGSPV